MLQYHNNMYHLYYPVILHEIDHVSSYVPIALNYTTDVYYAVQNTINIVVSQFVESFILNNTNVHCL